MVLLKKEAQTGAWLFGGMSYFNKYMNGIWRLIDAEFSL
jgi:hypothetical protein